MQEAASRRSSGKGMVSVAEVTRGTGGRGDGAGGDAGLFSVKR